MSAHAGAGIPFAVCSLSTLLLTGTRLLNSLLKKGIFLCSIFRFIIKQILKSQVYDAMTPVR